MTTTLIPSRYTKLSATFVLSIVGLCLIAASASTYPPQPANKSGEVHEHWSFFSYDRKRDVLVLRQFHQEGFVLQFAMTTTESSAKRLVFDSESLENVGTWRARETYDVISNDEVIETFELGGPGKPLQAYSKTHFKRV